MMEHHLTSPPFAKKARKRVGRGDSAGQGSTCGRGNKGQKSRSGKPLPPGFEGGQLPLIKGLPTKRGFTNIFKVQFSLVNVGRLGEFTAGSDITPELLYRNGVIRNVKTPVKVLGDGDLDVPLQVVAHKFTQTARQKIEAAGGTAQELH